MKKNKPFGELFYSSLKKTLLIMRIAVILMILGILQARANDAYSQKTMLSLNFSETPLVKVLDKIEDESEFFFMYNEKLLDTERKVNIEAKDQLISVILDNLFAGTNVNYTIIDRKIILAPDYLTEVPQPQQFKVSGTITDSKGGTLPGVNVILKGTLIGTNTDMEGRFTISVPDGNGILVFSFIGFTSQEITVNGSSKIDVKLSEEATALGEVVITALGIKREAKSLTYSTQGINAKEITEARELNVMNSLEGKVPGLSLNTSGSGLGADVRVVLRGDRSISGDSQPLYVIDGVPIRGNPANLNPDNIASISVLKGPNAAALYGSAAQNGVIIIETKKGSAGGINLAINTTYQVFSPIPYIQFQNEYGQGNGGKYEKSSEAAWGPKMEGQMVETWSLDPAQAGNQYALTPQPNNKNDIFKNGYNMATNILASAGSEKTQAAFSYTFTDAKGIIPTNTLQRHNLSVRMNSKLTQRLSLDTKIDYTRQQINNSLDEGGSNFNPVRQIFRMPPNIRSEDVEHFEFIDATGLLKQNWWNPATTTGSNPYWMMYRAPKENLLQRVMAMGSLSYDFSDALKLMTRVSYDGEFGGTDTKYYNNTFTRAVFGRYTVTKNDADLFNGDLLLSYTKEISKKWNINANLGGSFDRRSNSVLSANTGTALLVPNFFTLSNSTLVQASYNPGNNEAKQSLYAFGHVAYLNAIFLDVTGRNDWSSTLPAKNRSYFYPSIGLSAILSDLIPTFPDFFSNAKLRASWARVGNSAPPYMGGRTATFRAGGNNGYLSLGNTLPNPDLHPEQTEAYEFGSDLSFLAGRAGLNLTYYITNTSNQLFSVALPIGSGATQYFTNGGDVENKGIEILLTTTPVLNTKGLKWDLNFNFASNHNMVTKISDERPKVVLSSSDVYFKEFAIEVGKPYGELYSKGFVRDNAGNVIVGKNGLPLVTAGMTVDIGNVHPKWQGGITSSFTYNNFSASFLIDHRQGGVVASMTNAILAGDGILQQTIEGREGGLIFGSNFFTKENAVLEDGSPNTIEVTAEDFWKRMGGESAPVGEVFTYNATNTWLREVSIGYSLNKLAQIFGVANVRFSLVGRNLLLIYQASKNLEPGATVGTNPSSVGYSTFAPPTTRSIGGNLQINFK